MDRTVLQALLADVAGAAPTPAPELHAGNTLVLWADPQVPQAVLARLAQHRLLLALERPCRTGGRRAAELLLAAASGRLSWEQVVTGAVCSAQLEAKPQPGSQVVACNGCHALHVEACGQPQAAGTQLPTCWRCASPETGRRDWLSHSDVQALYQTQLGPLQTLQYIEAHRKDIDQVVRRAMLAMGPARDADLGQAQGSLRDPNDPLSRLCAAPPGAAARRELLGLVTAGVEALVATWTAFEKGWHAEWLALLSAKPHTDLDPKLRQLVSPPNAWTGCQVGSVRKRVAKAAPRFRLHVLLLQLPADPATPFVAWLDGAPLPVRMPAGALLASCAARATPMPRGVAGPAAGPSLQRRAQLAAAAQAQAPAAVRATPQPKGAVRLFGVDIPAKQQSQPPVQQRQQQMQQRQHHHQQQQRQQQQRAAAAAAAAGGHTQQQQQLSPHQSARMPPVWPGTEAALMGAPQSLAVAWQQAQAALQAAAARSPGLLLHDVKATNPLLGGLPLPALADLPGLSHLLGRQDATSQQGLSAIAAIAAAAVAVAANPALGGAGALLPQGLLQALLPPGAMALPAAPPPSSRAPPQQHLQQQPGGNGPRSRTGPRPVVLFKRTASIDAQQEAALQLLNLAELVPDAAAASGKDSPPKKRRREAAPVEGGDAAEQRTAADNTPLAWPEHCRARRSAAPQPRSKESTPAPASLSIEDEEAALALEGMDAGRPARPASRWRIPRTRLPGAGGAAGGRPTGARSGPRARVEGPCMNPECGITSSPCWRKGPPSMPVLCNACGTRWARSNSDRVPSASHGVAAAEEERAPVDVIPGQPRPATLAAAAAAAAASAGTASPKPAGARHGVAATGRAASSLSPSPLRSASPSPAALGTSRSAAAAAPQQAKAAPRPPLHTPRLPPRQPTPAAEKQTQPQQQQPDEEADAAAGGRATAGEAPAAETASAEEAMISAAAAMLRESSQPAAAWPSERAASPAAGPAAGSGQPGAAAAAAKNAAAERMAGLEAQARSRVIAAGVRAAVSSGPAPAPMASSFAAAFMQKRGASLPLRNGAAVPHRFANGWPTADGRTLSASFLDSASQQKAKQDLQKQLSPNLSRHPSAPAAASAARATPAEVRAAALSAPVNPTLRPVLNTTAAAAGPLPPCHRQTAAAAAADKTPERGVAAESDVSRPLTPALLADAARDAGRAATAAAAAPDATSGDAEVCVELSSPQRVGSAAAAAELAQQLGCCDSPDPPSIAAPEDPEALWAAAAELVAEARANGRLPPAPPTPPASPPLFGLRPLDEDRAQPLQQRWRPPLAGAATAAAGTAGTAARPTGRWPGSVLAAPSPPAVTARDPRAKQRPSALPPARQQPQQQQQRPQASLALAPGSQAATPASSAATLTDDGYGSGDAGAYDSDGAAGASVTQSALQAARKQRRKRKRLFTGGRRQPPAARPSAIVAAAAAQLSEDEDYVPLKRGTRGELKYGSVSTLYKRLPTVTAPPPTATL